MTERERIYDMICFTLTEYENDPERYENGWEDTLYGLLRTIQARWEDVITAEVSE